MAHNLMCKVCEEITAHITSVGCVRCYERDLEYKKSEYLLRLQNRSVAERLGLLEAAVYNLSVDLT